MRVAAILLFALSAILNSCSSDPVFPVEPKIEYLDIQPRTVRHLQDSILITFRFQDGDGNLGVLENSEDYNLLIIDSRINNGLSEAQATSRYTLPNLTPEARNPSIQGDISVKLDFTANLPGLLEEDIRYQIMLIDRDGNVAGPLDGETDNAVYTDYIKVVR